VHHLKRVMVGFASGATIGTPARITRGRTVPKPILVGYDPRSGDRAPVSFGVAAAKFTGAPLIVACAFSDGNAGHGHVHEDLDEEGHDALDRVRASFKDEGVAVEFRSVVGGSAPHALHDAAEGLDAALLVVGSSKHGRTGRLLPGSTAERLMHGAPCPLAIVPSAWVAGGGLHTIGVAYTDTAEGRRALDSAVGLARRAGARLRVLTAVKPHEIGKDAGEGPAKESTGYDVTGMKSQSAERHIAEAIGADGGGIEVESDVSVQDAASFLIAASENVDLLVCGSRGYGPRRAVLLGGVSRRVVAESACPVIVLARGVEFGLDTLVGEAEAATA
jgi:nucleotide-binding universal stress UspA family protein